LLGKEASIFRLGRGLFWSVGTTCWSFEAAQQRGPANGKIKLTHHPPFLSRVMAGPFCAALRDCVNSRNSRIKIGLLLALDGWWFTRLTWRRMSHSNSQTMTCPSCGEEIESAKRRCPHCGRPMGERGFFFYAFWVGLSLIVVALIACIFYTGFLMLNRML